MSPLRPADLLQDLCPGSGYWCPPALVTWALSQLPPAHRALGQMTGACVLSLCPEESQPRERPGMLSSHCPSASPDLCALQWVSATDRVGTGPVTCDSGTVLAQSWKARAKANCEGPAGGAGMTSTQGRQGAGPPRPSPGPWLPLALAFPGSHSKGASPRRRQRATGSGSLLATRKTTSQPPAKWPPRATACPALLGPWVEPPLATGIAL